MNRTSSTLGLCLPSSDTDRTSTQVTFTVSPSGGVYRQDRDEAEIMVGGGEQEKAAGEGLDVK